MVDQICCFVFCLGGGCPPPKQNAARSKAEPDSRNRPRAAAPTGRTETTGNRTRHPERGQDETPAGSRRRRPTEQQGDRRDRRDRQQQDSQPHREQAPANGKTGTSEPTASHKESRANQPADTGQDAPNAHNGKNKTGKQHEEHPQKRKSARRRNPKAAAPNTNTKAVLEHAVTGREHPT